MGSAEVCAKKPMNVALFVGLTAGRRICCRVGLAEGDELKSNVLHFCAKKRSASRSGLSLPFGEAGAGIAGGSRGAQFVQFKETLAEVRLYARNRAAYDRA